MMSLTKIAIVTGAAGDIGRATSLVLAAAGWTLAITDHPLAAAGLNDTHQLLAATGASVWSSACDVTDDDAVASLVASCVSSVGVPAGLFNNAGYQGRFAALPGYPPDDLRKVLEVNVVGVFQVLQHVARAMIDGQVAGAIVNTASMAGVGGAPNMPAYSASKAAVIGLTKSAAKDLAPSGIRLNAISPAFIGPGKMWDNQVASQAATKSQYYAHDPAAVAEQMIAMVPLRRYGSVDEVAAVVEFLLSEKASYVTGQNIEITGGSA
jgi:NAD(P)-dependent dehydrogenase (short-subunit alcohol dehydrogenase family)